MLTTLDIPTADLVRVRRHFHKYPELSLQEYTTSAYLLSELQGFGFDEIRSKVAGTGILATLQGGKPGPVTLLRADMDALPITEISQTEYASQHPGIMHACGHDGHMSILLAAAKTLCRRRDEVAGTLVFCFQPAEEGPAGARMMIEAGALEDPHIDRVFGLHLYTNVDVGFVAVRDHAFFASADHFRLQLIGQGGHGAMPDRAIDPIVAGAQLVSSLQSIVSREIPTNDPAVITVAHFNSGTTFNVIPDEALLEGTVRCFSPEIRASMPQRIERIIQGIASAYRVTPKFEYRMQYPPVVNNRAMTDLVRTIGSRVVGKERLIEHEIVMFAEDMAFFLQERPGSFFLVGARGSEATSFQHHSARFDIDERALEVGYAMMVTLGLGEI